MAGSPISSRSGGLPLGLPGATAATRYVGATAAGAPASGTFAVGDFTIDQSGKVFVCTAAGTPGTWTEIGGVAATWSAFTPTLTGSTTNPSGLAVISGRQLQQGGLVFVRAYLGYGAAPTVGSGDFRMSLPVQPSAATAWDAGFLPGGMLYDSSTTTAVMLYPRLDSANTRVTFFSELDGVTLPCTSMAANDQIHLAFFYEAL